MYVSVFYNCKYHESLLLVVNKKSSKTLSALA